MTLNTREVDQKFQIYSVIFPFLLVFLWVPTNWGFEKQKILGTSSSFGRFVSNKRHPRIGPGGSFGELALLYFAPRAATVEVGGVFSVGPLGFFGTGVSRWLFWGLQIFIETAGPKKRRVGIF